MEKQSPTGRGMLDGDALLAALDKPALIVDREGVIIQVNRAAQSLNNAENTCVQCGAPLSELLPSMDDYWPDEATGFDTRHGIECTELDARVRVRGAPLCSREGRFAGWLVLLQAEVEERGEQRLRSLLASMDDLVFVIDLDGRIVEYHQQASDGLASLNRLMLGKHYRDVFPDSTVRKFTKMMAVVRDTEQIQRFDHLLVVDDEEHWYSTNIGLLRGQDQEMTGFLVVARNITERKRTETAEREQRVLAEALQDVALALNSTLNLEEIWIRILANVARVVPADAAAILLVEQGIARVVGERGYSERGFGESLDGYEIEVASLGRLQYMTRTRQPCLIPDVRKYENWLQQDSTRQDLSRTEAGMTADSVPDGVIGGRVESPYALVDRQNNWARSYLGAPIVLDDEVIGFLKLESAVLNYFTPKDAERLRAFGDHAASAIRNARLYAQAQELAAVQERQRLARELHDAVSQMLFSAKIIAEMLPRLRERDPESVWTYLPELQRLIQGAMGEMRMLLLELRPAILTDVDLSVLLGYLVDAAAARTSAKISLNARDVSPVPAEVQVALYRIAQEALANAIKHAHANAIDVSVQRQGDGVLLRIQDEGVGFEAASVRPENLGLNIMRERAEEIGARLRVDSVLKAGTVVEVRWAARGSADEEGR